MSAQQLAKESYQNTQRELASDKAIELRIFASITSRMRAVDLNEIGGFPKLAQVLTENTKLWNLLLIDLVNPENPLPLDLKTSIIGLAEFTQRHTLKVLEGEATHDVLLDINQAMIDGLRKSLLAEFPDDKTEMEAA